MLTLVAAVLGRLLMLPRRLFGIGRKKRLTDTYLRDLRAVGLNEVVQRVLKRFRER